MTASRLIGDTFEAVFIHIFTHFGRYLCYYIANISFQTLKSSNIHVAMVVNITASRKSNSVKSHDLAGQQLLKKRNDTFYAMNKYIFFLSKIFNFQKKFRIATEGTCGASFFKELNRDSTLVFERIFLRPFFVFSVNYLTFLC